MKKKLVEMKKPVKTRKKGGWITVQMIDNILVLNIYDNGRLLCRHCVNKDTGEYETLRDGIWYKRQIGDCFSVCQYDYCYTSWNSDKIKDKCSMPEDDKNMILNALPHSIWENKPYDVIQHVEYEYSRKKRENAEKRRRNHDYL